MAPGQQAWRCSLPARAGNDCAQCRAAGLRRRVRRDDRTGGAELAAEACPPALVGTGDPARPAHGSIASSWPTSAGTSSRPAAGSASDCCADRGASRPDIAPAAGPDETSAFYYRDPRASNGPVAVAQLGFRYGPIEIDPSERASRWKRPRRTGLDRAPAGEGEGGAQRLPISNLSGRAKFPSLDSAMPAT